MEQKQNKPLGVHLGPLLQFGPAANGQMPNISLPTQVSNPDRHKRGNVTHPEIIWWIAPCAPSPPSKSFWKPTKSPKNPFTMSSTGCGANIVGKGSVLTGVPSAKPPPDDLNVKFLRIRWGTGYGRMKSSANAPVVIWKSSEGSPHPPKPASGSGSKMGEL